MILCNDYCTPCCDFCIHVVHEELWDNTVGGPIGCTLHEDQWHQDIAQNCGYCDDFCCFGAVRE